MVQCPKICKSRKCISKNEELNNIKEILKTELLCTNFDLKQINNNVVVSAQFLAGCLSYQTSSKQGFI